VTAAGFKPATF